MGYDTQALFCYCFATPLFFSSKKMRGLAKVWTTNLLVQLGNLDDSLDRSAYSTPCHVWSLSLDGEGMPRPNYRYSLVNECSQYCKIFFKHSVIKWRKIQAKFLNKILENFMGKAFKVQVANKILTKRDCFLSSRYVGKRASMCRNSS
jgi:hypothetical protein